MSGTKRNSTLQENSLFKEKIHEDNTHAHSVVKRCIISTPKNLGVVIEANYLEI